jgi:hypothetical protein
VSERKLSARPIGDGELRDAELLIDRLDLPAAALTNLAVLAARDEEEFWLGDQPTDGWAACIEADGTSVLARGDLDEWGFYAPPGADEADAMLTARKLHGLLGEQSEGWDLDR